MNAVVFWAWCIVYATTVASQNTNYDVIILGGGATAVRAAAALNDLGITNIKIIERRPTLGGSIGAASVGGHVVELGAMRIFPSDGEIYDLIRNAVDTMLYNRTVHIVRDVEENDRTTEADLLITQFRTLRDDVVMPHVQELQDSNFPDPSAKALFESQGFNAESDLNQWIEFWEYGPRDPDLVSLKYQYSSSPDSSLLVNPQNDPLGFAKFFRDYVNENVQDINNRLDMNKTVSEIQTAADRVTVRLSGGTNYTAKYLIIAQNIGELQHTAQKITPPLPSWKLDAIYAYKSVHYLNFYMRFNMPVADWFIPDNVVRIGTVSHRPHYFPLWINVNSWQRDSMLLRGLAVREDAVRLKEMTDADIQSEAVGVLQAMFGENRVPQPVEIYVPRDEMDPLLYGDASYWPAGYTKEQHMALLANTGRVHYAGDYTMVLDSSGLKAEWEAGLSVAKRVKECRDSNEDGCETPAYILSGCTYPKANNYNRYALRDDGSCTFTTSASTPIEHVTNIVVAMLVAMIVALLEIY